MAVSSIPPPYRVSLLGPSVYLGVCFVKCGSCTVHLTLSFTAGAGTMNKAFREKVVSPCMVYALLELWIMTSSCATALATLSPGPSNFLQFKVQVLAILLNESQSDDFIYHFGKLEQVHIQFQNPLVPISHFAPFMTNPCVWLLLTANCCQDTVLQTRHTTEEKIWWSM